MTGATREIDAIHCALADAPDITAIVEEAAGTCSVPYGDNLPEWTALRIYCQTDSDVTAFMDRLRDRLAGRIGKHIVNALSFSAF